MTQSQRTATSSHLLALLPDADPQALAQTLVAFANTDGGTIALGFDERGKPHSSVMPEDIESALREAATRTTPPVRASLDQTASANGGTTLLIRVPRSMDLHSMADGRVYVRVGARTAH